MDSEDKFIAGIHNYCDRWCERCTFTARCRVAEVESGMTDDERDVGNEAFWRNLKNVFADAKQMIQEKAAELGIDIEPLSAEEFAEYREREDRLLKDQELTKLAEKYWKQTRQTLENTDDWLIFAPLDEDAQSEMLAILHWYQFFISAKIQRGFHGLLDFEGGFAEEELNDVQSDANGSIKIALIAVDRSLMAWTALKSRENAETIAPHIALLETIKQTAEKKFPHARDFVRPGFDEIEEFEAVM